MENVGVGVNTGVGDGVSVAVGFDSLIEIVMLFLDHETDESVLLLVV